MQRFSLLMCVYIKESPEFFARCIDSVLAQTVLPDEWIIVKDGPLNDELESVIAGIRFPNELKIIALPKNVTQGPARAEGVKAAKYDWIAIMDSDDICVPDRFEKQLEMIEADRSLSLIGGQIAEFTESVDKPISIRAVPCTHEEIIAFVKKRNPFSQMTVMMKRESAIAAGNYGYFPGFEDYDLWARMIKNGAKCANHPDILVHARVSSMHRRRRGLSYIKWEWRMQKRLRSLGLTSTPEHLRNVVLRIPIRLLPERLLSFIYSRFARNKALK